MSFRKKITGLTPSQFATRAIKWAMRKIDAVFEESWARAGGFEIKSSALPSLLDRTIPGGNKVSPVDAAVAVLDCVANLIGSEHEHVIELTGIRFTGEIDDLIKSADLAASRKFRILGVDLDYSSGIRWNYDPANDHEFDPTEFYSRVKHSNPSGGWDIKYPWELSRLQHLPRMALAWSITDDEKYIQGDGGIVRQVEDWIAGNPVGFGPNWACTMDVAIRAANLALAFAFLGDVKFDDDFALSVVRSLISHGRFIRNHLEWSNELTSNHYLADIAGLAVLGCLLAPSVKEAAAWRDFAKAELEKEIIRQVNPDGSDFEASTAYHRLALECFLYPAIILSLAGFSMSGTYLSRLRDMVLFSRDFSMPDGSFPLIGDNDSGQFFKLHPPSLNNLNYLLVMSASFLKDPSLKTLDVKPCRYPDGGFLCLRSDDALDMITLRAGEVGQKGRGGHAHNDALSITVWFGGKPVIIDPGTAVYTSDPAKRNLYRSTESHATISMRDEEQNQFVEGDLFSLLARTRVESGLVESIIEATMTFGDLTITRHIEQDKDKRQFEINDKIKAGGRPLLWNFPLAPELKPGKVEADCVKILNSDGVAVAEILSDPGWVMKIDQTHCAPEYGYEVPNVTLRFAPPGDTGLARFVIRGL